MFKNKVLILLLFSVAFAPNYALAKNCKKGQPCGNSCISWKKTCHKNKIYSTSSTVKSYSSSSLKSTRNYSVAYLYVTVDSLNVRNGPSTKNSVIGKLSKGEKVLVSTSENGWKRITYNNKVAWANGRYLSLYQP